MAYLVAITSSCGKNIDLHFGSAKHFYIVELDLEKTGWSHRGIRHIPEESPDVYSAYQSNADKKCSGVSDSRLGNIGNLLADCAYVLTQKIGVRPYKFLQKIGITCLESPPDMDEALRKLVKYLQTTCLSAPKLYK
ncbi:MAG: hypothetical protein LBV76_01385 [Deltaproteobacteria bacterium]|jgi:predicted Fe-Mo cluster-binding NifX family protein|nr:hypothetical protein [Deltaproteobacteria bacterium]